MLRAVLVATALLACLAARADQEAGKRPPLTVGERISTCVEAEDVDPAHAIALADSVLAEGAALSLAQRAEALGCRGWSQASTGRNDEARRDAHTLHNLLQQFPGTPDRVRLTRRAGSILHRSGDRVGAVDMYAKALADSEVQNLEAERIPLLVNLGVLHSEFEEHERARVNYEQALALMDRLDDHRYEAPVRFNLGLNLNGQQRYAEAVPHFQRALELVRSTGIGGPAQEISVSLALAGALFQTGEIAASQALIERVRAIDVPLHDSAMQLQLLLIEASQLAAAGDAHGALGMLDGVAIGELPEIQQWQLLIRRADLLQRLGRFQEEAQTLRRINELRETYLRHQNHERLAALETHMRDREQRIELERLQSSTEAQERRLAATARLQWATAGVAGMLLLFGSGVLLWQRRMNRRLDRVSRTDPLTGLANRRDMTQRLRSLSLVQSTSASLMLIDIDLFKQINDEYGHDVGDEVLTAFAQRLRDCVGAEAGVARWGGEEFLVLLPGADAEATRAMADALRQRLSWSIRTGSGPIQVGASIGYANLPLPGAHGSESWHHSLQLADSALYLAKRSGRDAWAGYWLDQRLPGWPPERLGRQPDLARSLGLISPVSSRQLPEALVAVV